MRHVRTPHPSPRAIVHVPASPEPPSAPPGARRRRISKKASLFVIQFAAQNFQDPDRAAKAVGFARPGAGYKLASRLSDLIETERLRREMAEQMELDEALRLLAETARDRSDAKTQLAALRTVLQVHGVLSDKPLPPADRRSLASQVEVLISRIRERMTSAPGSTLKIRAAFEAESGPGGPESGPES